MTGAVPKFTAAECRDALERELRFRRRVYPARVADGKMTQQLADRQIAIFEQIRAEYDAAAAKERLL